MAAKESKPTHKQHIQQERFSSKQHGYGLWYLSLDLTGNIAVSGNHNSRRTYIDLYSGNNTDFRVKLKLFYSKEFENYSDYSGRYASFLDKNVSKLVTCIGDKIEIIDTQNESNVLRSCRVNGEIITCLAVREEEIFIGLDGSQTVLVFNSDLEEMRKIRIKGIESGHWPWDLQVIKDTVFLCTASWLQCRALSSSVYDGSTVSEYTDTTGMYSNAFSIAVSEEINLVAVLWSDYPKKGIIVYSLDKNQPILVFDVDDDVTRIRISDKDRMIITGDWQTGEIKLYDLEQLFSFEAMKRTLAFLVSPDACEELRQYFGVTEDEMRILEAGEENTVKRMECLLAIIEEKGYLDPYNIKTLKDAVSALDDESHISNIKGPMEGYSLYGKNMKMTVTAMMTRLIAWEDESYQLSSKLETAESKVKEYEKNLDDLRGELADVTKQAHEQEKMLKEDLNIGELKIRELKGEKMTLKEELQQFSKQMETLKVELEQIKLKSAKKKEILIEKLNQTKRSKTESDRQIKTLTYELKQSKTESDIQVKTLREELKQSMTEADRQVQTLTEILKQTKQSKTESERQIQRLTEELKQTKHCNAETDIKIETLMKELAQIRTESSKKIETLTEELEQTQMKSAKDMKTLKTELKQAKQSKTESDRQIGTLTEEIRQTNQTKAVITETLTQVKRELHSKMERLTEELKQNMQVLDITKTDYANNIQKLITELNETKQKMLTRIKELETTSEGMEVTRQALEETAQGRDNTMTELKQYQQGVLNQAKEAMTELHKGSVEDKPLDGSEETRDKGGAILAAEFGRLTVAIAEHLTLDQCLKLARVCNLPASDCDTVLRVSMIQSPGMKFLDILQKRKVINMFDVTNLQKALLMLRLEAVNHDLVAPYQEKIDKKSYEQNKVEETYTWEEIDAFFNVTKDLSAHQIRDSQTSPVDGTEPIYAPQKEVPVRLTEAGEEGRRSLLESRHHHQLYTEHSIGRKGGTIQLANVSLTVPTDALHESRVIALTVMNESPFPLDREVDTERMSPLVKLEPLGLIFKKPVQLHLPHFAFIPEPENHDVIIYSGQIINNNEDSSGSSISWTEERSIPRQLKKKSVTVDIQCLTYLSASLATKPSAPPLCIVRAVPFVDGIRNTDDDITLTICFCSDNDLEYNMLLSDYCTKLPLEKYSTLQLHPLSGRDEDDAGFLSVTVTSVNKAYVPDADQSVKQLAISHLCTASRVSHQLRLQKNQDIDKDVVDIVLQFSQAESTPTRIFMKARIKDLMISQEVEELLIGHFSTAFKPYEDLKADISRMLEYDHCRKIAVYFRLSPAEAESVEINEAPGKKLMKILDEREIIMPQKLFEFYQGLKVCHLDKIARIVLVYIEKYSNDTQEERHVNEKEKRVKGFSDYASVSPEPLQTQQTRRSQTDQSVQTTFSVPCPSSGSLLEMLDQELHHDRDNTSGTLSSTHRLDIFKKWTEGHPGMMKFLILMFVDGILQSQRGVFLLPRWFKN